MRIWVVSDARFVSHRPGRENRSPGNLVMERPSYRDPRIYQVTKAAVELLRGGGFATVESVLGFEDGALAKAGATTITGTGAVINSEATGFDQAMAEYSAFFAIIEDAGFQRLPF